MGKTEERKTEERKTEERKTEERKTERRKTIGKFEDLDVWKESVGLSIEIYKHFSEIRDYGFKDQIQRSVISIPSNIAEGYDRDSNKEYVRFLYISRGSCAELRTQLTIAKELKYLTKTEAEDLIDKTRKISAMLYNLIQTRIKRFGK